MTEDIFEFPTKNISNTTGSYEQIIRSVFFSKYKEGATSLDFARDEINGNALNLKPKNIGDIIYTYRYRLELPDDIQACAPADKTWIIEGVGDGLYRFRAVSYAWFTPNPNSPVISLPDCTPEEVLEHRNRDEQAILASIAYNRLLDLFLGCRLERKQSHWRTKVAGIGQIEIDDVYIGVDGSDGSKVVVTVQAKRDKDRVSSVQIMQDIMACREKRDERICRPVAVHYDSSTGRLACMEFAEDGIDIKLINEKHYVLTKPTIVV